MLNANFIPFFSLTHGCIRELTQVSTAQLSVNYAVRTGNDVNSIIVDSNMGAVATVDDLVLP